MAALNSLENLYIYNVCDICVDNKTYIQSGECVCVKREMCQKLRILLSVTNRSY